MDNIENKLKTTRFWLQLGAINHLIALVVIALSCVYSGFTCRGDLMKDALSLYAFTIFTPQIALEVIVLMAIFLVTTCKADFSKNSKPLTVFVASFILLILFSVWQ